MMERLCSDADGAGAPEGAAAGRLPCLVPPAGAVTHRRVRCAYIEFTHSAPEILIAPQTWSRNRVP